jgi:hypothetical protein
LVVLGTGVTVAGTGEDAVATSRAEPLPGFATGAKRQLTTNMCNSQTIPDGGNSWRRTE